MIRNPWGFVNYKGILNSLDPILTSKIINQVPIRVDPKTDGRLNVIFI